jgi:hypothetical protein
MSALMKCFIGSMSRSVVAVRNGPVYTAPAMKRTKALNAVPRMSNFGLLALRSEKLINGQVKTIHMFGLYLKLTSIKVNFPFFLEKMSEGGGGFKTEEENS